MLLRIATGVLGLTALTYMAMAADAANTTAARTRPAHGTFENTVTPFMARNCYGCHNNKLKSGELNIQQYTTAEGIAKDRDTWERIFHKIQTGEMPPKPLPRPKSEDVTAIVNWLESEFDRQDREAKPDPGRVTARRLNRYEYNNTIHDLLGVTIRPADDFPADDSGYGFDHIGDVLSISPVLMEKYLKAADQIAKAAIVAGPVQIKATRERFEAERMKRGGAPLQPDAAGPVSSNLSLFAKHKFPYEGEYEIRLGMGGIRPDTAPDPVRLAAWLDGERVGEWEVIPGRDKKRNFDLQLKITPGYHTIGATAVNDKFDPAKHPITSRDRYLQLDSLELRGPFNPAQPPLPESHKRIFFCGTKDDPCAREIIANLARRAFRRPVTDHEIDKLAGFVKLAQDDGDSFEQGIRVALQAILVSPHFLFRLERHPDASNAAAVQPISEFELATRLSYFLWSTMPDEELFRLAEQNQLRNNLAAQVKRMIANAKAHALAENFAGQWLELRNLDSIKPDPDKFPEFDDELRKAMRTETQLFFESIVKENRGILDFLDAKYTFLNDRLAEHYGIDGVEGSQFRRVDISKNPQRGGVLSHASILTVSSYPTRTSPVIRGKWILENFLAAPPPPPPPNVPNLDEAAVGATGTLRQQLEKHRSNAICASCHQRMDPLGFGLENYNAIGQWRNMDGKFPIDSAGTLPNGKSFKTPAELRSILKSDKDAFARCLTEKLMTYALGRGLERYDKPAVKSITNRLPANGYRFSALVMQIVNSMPFQMRRGETGKS